MIGGVWLGEFDNCKCGWGLFLWSWASSLNSGCGISSSFAPLEDWFCMLSQQSIGVE